MTRLTEQDIDRLALDAGEIIGFKSGSTVAYDVAGYQRCVREPVAPETLPTWGLEDLNLTRSVGQPLPAEARFDEVPYPARLAGFRRRDMFGPDEIGERFRSLGIAFNDGLGNGLYESLLIDRKYGLQHVIEAPILGFQLPFLDADWLNFKKLYPQAVERWLSDLKEMEAIYHGPLASSGEKMVVLWARRYPLDLFTNAYMNDPEAVSQEMQDQLGFAAPPVEPRTPAERAALVRFWAYVREKLSRILIYEADQVRAALGPGTNVVANPHELPVLDMEGQARGYEYPSVAIRPLLLNDRVFLRHYIAYFTQLFHDLTGKRPMVSVRMNLSAASPQFVPTGDLIRCWYDQAIRHGAGAFYFWTRDYPTQEGVYDGPIPGNPTPSTLPKERWEATLEMLSLLSNRKRFLKPAAEVAILAPTDSALLNRQEWRRIYAAFSALAEASIHTRFLSDRQIERGGVPGEVRLILAPALEFVSPALRDELEKFSSRGGALLLTSKDLFDRNGLENISLRGGALVDRDLFEIFPLDRPATSVDLERSAQALAQEVERRGIDSQAWVFDIHCENLPASPANYLREPDPSVVFAPWMYEHGSEWIMPYLGKDS